MLSLEAALGGFVIGLALGALGGGGSTLTVPLLLALGVETKQAIAASLLVVASSAALGAGLHARAGRVDWRAAAWLLPSVAVGGYLGGRATAFVPAEHLLRAFALLLVVAGLAMWAPRPAARGRPARPALLAAAGLAIGALTGLLGVGGGFLFVPALVLAAGLALPRAIATSLVAIAANALAGFAGQLEHVSLPLALVLPLLGGGALGALLGARLAGRLPERALRRGFALLLLAIAAWLLGRAST